MIFSQGSRFGGHALYVKRRKLKYAYNWVGEHVQIVEPTSRSRPGTSCSPPRSSGGHAMPTRERSRLHVRDQKVGEARIRTQPGKFGLGGGGLVVGRSGAEPVTDDYAGDAPWAFVGGTIKRVVIDVSGEAFADLGGGGRAAFARQ